MAMVGVSAEMPVPIVRGAGSRYDVGYVHGSSVSDLVAETLRWSLGQLATVGVSREEAIEGATRLLAFVELATPELMEEVTGIANGSGLSLAEVGIINSRYELMQLHGKTDNGALTPGCTIFGIDGARRADNLPVIGQNVDLGPESRPLWIILDVSPHGCHRVATVTLAGMLAQEGINSAGLAVCGSMVRCRGWRVGYPTRKFLRRKVLEQASVKDAIQVIRSCERRASSHNLMLADTTGRLVDVETTISDVRILESSGGVITHSNHYLSHAFRLENAVVEDYLPNTQARCSRMRELLGGEDLLPTAVLANALRDHQGGNRAICRHAALDESGAETNVSVISEPGRRRMHVAFGPPCEAPYITYSLF